MVVVGLAMETEGAVVPYVNVLETVELFPKLSVANAVTV
jgi:hypothetical protein